MNRTAQVGLEIKLLGQAQHYEYEVIHSSCTEKLEFRVGKIKVRVGSFGQTVAPHGIHSALDGVLEKSKVLRSNETNIRES
jgi:hypothetical protein